MAAGWILTLNAGSSSLKLAAFDAGARPLARRALDGHPVTEIGADLLATETAALGQDGPPALIGHRIVHGLTQTAPAELTAHIRAVVEQASAFAPLHNPPALHIVDLATALFPSARQGGCFDTAFHAGNPEGATQFPIPETWRAQGIRRYGFHGLSFASLVRRFQAETGHPLPSRLLLAHLGSGASLAAVRNGRGVATTMGFSPMDGLVMATRAGAIDPGVIFHLIRAGQPPERVEHMLNRESGLLALGGSTSMKALLARDDAAAKAAVGHYVYWLRRHAGAMCAAMNGIDGLVFTGGVGENAAPIRDQLTEGLAWAGLAPDQVWVLPADEEGEIATAMAALFA